MKKRIPKLLYQFLIILPLIIHFYQNSWAFGKNKLITKDFLWQVKSIDHFDIYYYGKSGKNLLPLVETYLDNAFSRVTSVLPANPSEQIPLFLYNNHNDFEQTNITLIGEGTGGVTEAYKNRFLVAHLGSQRYLEYVLTHEFTHEIQYEYLFSGFWRSIRLVKFMFYPLWLMEGLAEYTRGDFDRTTREMYIRDAATTGNLLPLAQLHSFNHVMPHQVTLAYKESEALIHYLVDEYGRGKLAKLLISYQERFDPDSVLLDVYGTTLSTLDKRFREYLVDKYTISSSGLSEPSEYGEILTKHGSYPRFYESAVFSPDSSKLAYISDERGAREIYVMDLERKKSVRLWDLTKSIKVENIHNEGNGLSFSPDGKYIVFAGERKQRDRIYIYDLENNENDEIDIKTESVASPSFSNNGERIYFSGLKEGFRNIFEYSLKTKKLVQLTTGYMDKMDAVNSYDGRKLVFACERINPKGRIEYDLCIMDVETKKSEFLTSLPGDERYPCFSSDGKYVYFTSDQDGINDIYRISLNSGNIDRLTKVIGGNFQPKVSSDNKKLLFSSFRRGERHLYLQDMEKIKPSVFYKRQEEKIDVVSRSKTTITSERNDKSPAMARPYRFKVSTDLFFPVIFYSSLDGLYLATYWQISEFLGNHQLQSMVTFASAAEYLDYSVSYGFLRYRPQFYLTVSGYEHFEYYSSMDDYKKNEDNLQAIQTLYPLNRFQRLEFLMGTINRKEYWDSDPSVVWRSRENIAGISFYHDVVQGPYLESTSGWRLRITGEVSERVLDGDYSYHNAIVETHKFFPLGKEHVLGWRSYIGGSFGQNSGFFRLGGEDRVRGVSRDMKYSGHRVFLNNIEWRFPIVYNINYHLGFMFPDFFFKTFYGALFVDSGVTWNEDIELKNIPIEQWHGSYGLGLRFHTFLLQSYPVLLNFQLARKMEGPSHVFYFTMGTNF
ncbi:MAG: PD40 domain-containing protein [Endomicrobiales bacterium]|nr:PD40 domain-containing protein [Endomicrobiales bacterium]